MGTIQIWSLTNRRSVFLGLERGKMSKKIIFFIELSLYIHYLWGKAKDEMLMMSFKGELSLIMSLSYQELI
jgi:hypothetical protein